MVAASGWPRAAGPVAGAILLAGGGPGEQILRKKTWQGR